MREKRGGGGRQPREHNSINHKARVNTPPSAIKADTSRVPPHLVANVGQRADVERGVAGIIKDVRDRGAVADEETNQVALLVLNRLEERRPQANLGRHTSKRDEGRAEGKSIGDPSLTS